MCYVYSNPQPPPRGVYLFDNRAKKPPPGLDSILFDDIKIVAWPRNIIASFSLWGK